MQALNAVRKQFNIIVAGSRETRFGTIHKHVVIHKQSNQQIYPLPENDWWFGEAECEHWIYYNGEKWLLDWNIEQILLNEEAKKTV